MYRNFTTTATKGYSLVEVLVAVSILMIAIVGPLTIAAKSIQSSQYARQQITAYFLAQEGVSLVQIIRNNESLVYVEDVSDGDNIVSEDPWEWVNNAASPYTALDKCFNTDGCNIDARDSTLLTNISDCSTAASCVLEVSSGTPDATNRSPLYKTSGASVSPYSRIIRLTAVNTPEVEVLSTVSWTSNLLGGTQEVKLESSIFNIYK